MKAPLPWSVSLVFFVCCHLEFLYASDPLDHWESVANHRISLRGMAYQGGRFVAAGATTNLIVSLDGEHWPLISSGVTNSQLLVMAVADGAGKFVAVGGAGLILTSSNGMQWSQTHFDINDEYWAVIYATGQFVVVGYSWQDLQAWAVALISTDGEHWERFVQPFATTPRNIAFGNGFFVAAGAPASMYSTNGRDWVPLPGVLAQGIAYGDGRFVATLGRVGYLSRNGVDWDQIELPTVQSGESRYEGNYYTATHANGLFMIGGFCDECPNALRPAYVATSADGEHWTSRPFATNTVGAIRDIVFVDGTFYLADQSGRIWRSDRMELNGLPRFSGIRREGGQIVLSIEAVAGYHYLLECTKTLEAEAWAACAEPIFVTESPLELIVPDSGGQTVYYRLRTQ